MIKAIVFDLGGVLFREGKSIAATKLQEKYKYEPKIIFKVLTSPKSVELRKGLISDEEFWSWVQKQLPKGYSASLIKKEWYDGYIVDRDIFDLLKKLRSKKKYELIIFSSNIKSRIEYLERKYHFRKFFHQEIYSYEHGLNKPDREFVELLINGSGFKPEELAYIDDLKEPLKSAKELGIFALIYEPGKIQELEHKLIKLGVDL